MPLQLRKDVVCDRRGQQQGASFRRHVMPHATRRKEVRNGLVSHLGNRVAHLCRGGATQHL